MDTKDGKLITYPALWQKKLDSIGKYLSMNAVGGPCTSYELAQHDQTEVAFCGSNMEDLQYLKSIMQTDYYHISLSTDIVGIESAVALKNGYALGVALTVGLNQRTFGLDSELHYNSQAAVFGQAIKEMAKLLEFQGAPDLNNLCVGAGDLYVTVYGGRTRKIGILLGEGKSYDEAMNILAGVTLESLVVARRVAKAIYRKAELGQVDLKDFPMLVHVENILEHGADAEHPWESYTFDNTK
jgi:glycerol-3-phosphate dehydrogenase (NAD(P)+)